MKTKKIWKNILGLSTIVSSFILPISYQNNLIIKSSDQDNFLSLATPDNEIEKIKNLNFTYNKSQGNIIYINESNKDIIAKQVAASMFEKETFFYDDAIYTVNSEIRNYYNKVTQKSLTSHSFEDVDGQKLLNFFYYFREKSNVARTHAIRVINIPVLNYLKWNNIGDNRYTISFTIPFIWAVGSNTTLEEMIKYPDLENATYFDSEIKNLFLTISFGNIIFEQIPNYISNFNYREVDPMDLNYNTLKSLFKLNNQFEPSSLSYVMEENKHIYKISVKKITYEIKNDQNFNLYYEGNYTIVFLEGNYTFNWDVIKSRHNLIILTTDDLWNELVINKTYKNMIQDIKLEKDYVNNKIKIIVNFDQLKYQNLLFYSFMNQYFETKTFDIEMDIDNTISFKLKNNCKNILFKNFNIDNLEAYFNLLPYDINVESFDNVKKDEQNKKINFTANIITTIENKKYNFAISSFFNDFENYSFLDINIIKNFFDNNFYDENNNLEINKIYSAFNDQSNWKYLVISSDNLLFKNLDIQILQNSKEFKVCFDVYNNLNLYLDSTSINVPLKQTKIIDDKDNNKNNQDDLPKPTINTNNKNLNYLWILIILIPILIFIIYTYYKKRNKI